MIDYGKGVRIFAPEELLPSVRAIEQLNTIAEDERISSPVVGLVDIHDKQENDFPTGTVAVSHDYIFPQLMVSGANCGMRMLTLPVVEDDLGGNDIDRLFRALSEAISTSSLLGEKLLDEDIMNIMRLGACWIEKKYPGIKEDLEYIESNGNAFEGSHVTEDMIVEAIPKFIIDISKNRMGMLGGGNHFLELQRVEEIFDEESASIFSIKKKGLCFLMHSGSGGLGAVVSHFYSPRSLSSREIRMHAFIMVEWLKSMSKKKIRSYLLNMFRHRSRNNSPLFGLKENTGPAELYLTAIKASANFAYANRAFITRQVKEVLSRQLHIGGDSIKTLYDASHISIKKEKHDSRRLWVHRIGAVSAFSAEALPEENIFKQTGIPAFLPGSMGDATYICVSQEPNDQTYYSIGHGAGRLSEEHIKEHASSRKELVKYLSSRSVVLYKGNSRKIVRQDPRCFKDIDRAAVYLKQQRLVKLIARLKPLAVLKG